MNKSKPINSTASDTEEEYNEIHNNSGLWIECLLRAMCKCYTNLY